MYAFKFMKAYVQNISEQKARANWRDGCVIGHHAPLPRAEAQGSDRAASRRDAVSAQRRRRRRRRQHLAAHITRLHARNCITSHGYGG